MVSGLTFKSLIHFELNFVYDKLVVQFSHHCLLKRLSFAHCIFLPPFLQINIPSICGFISELSILFH